ncbi:MAG: hypothetical protein KBC64_03020 [Simkaniaceae bacterium]|nr:hypothetical protein [Simkaniaceae bacterium]
MTAPMIGLPITENFHLAKEMAEVYQKPLILAFVGSDWAPPFDVSDFEHGIGNQCLLVKIDFPEINRQAPKQIEENHALKEKFKVTAFPTMILLTSSCEEIARFGEVGSFQILEAIQSYQNILAQIVSHKEPTRALYMKAKQLGSPKLVALLMQKGVEEQDPYFSMEQYAQMVGEGKGLTQDAERLKFKVLSSDPENLMGVHLRCAMLEFQAHESLEKPLEAVAPLVHYIQGIGQNDPDLWQIQLFISEYLMKHNLREEAMKYAESSIKGAPREIRDEVTQVIDSNGKLEGPL